MIWLGIEPFCAGFMRELSCIVMRCPANHATGDQILANNNNDIQVIQRHGVQVVGGSNPLAPANYIQSLQ
jgi:hypothetical protein